MTLFLLFFSYFTLILVGRILLVRRPHYPINKNITTFLFSLIVVNSIKNFFYILFFLKSVNQPNFKDVFDETLDCCQIDDGTLDSKLH